MSRMQPPEMPEYREIKWAVLQYVEDGRVYMFGDIEPPLEDYFELTEEQRDWRRPAGDKHFYHDCNNACKYLADLGLLERVGGFYQDREYRITPLGREVARRQPCNIVKTYVEQVRRDIENASRLRRV